MRTLFPLLSRLPGRREAKAPAALAQIMDELVRAAPEQSRVGALQVGRAASPADLAPLTACLLAHAPPGTELAVVTVSGPDQAPRSCTETEYGRPLRTVQSYLFIRCAGPASGYAQVVAGMCRDAGLSAVELDGVDVLRLLAPWCTAASNNETLACVSGIPDIASHHPLQQLAFVGARRTRTFECVRILVPDEPSEGALEAEPHPDRRPGRRAWAHVGILIRGEPQAVQEESEQHHGLLLAAGIAAARDEVGGAGPLTVLPLLSPFPPAALARERLHSAYLAPLLPLPWGRSASERTPVDGGALWLRDHLAAAVPLDMRNRHAPGGPNLLALGQAGAGLTCLANAVMAGHVRADGRGWTLSRPGNAVLADAYGTATLALDPTRPQSLNPLAGWHSREELDDVADILMTWLIAAADLEHVDVSDKDNFRFQQALSNALRVAWSEAREMLGLRQFLSALERDGQAGVDVSARIRARLSALAPDWFEGPCSLDPQCRFLDIATGAIVPTGCEAFVAQTVVALHTLDYTRALKRRHLRAAGLLVIDGFEMLGAEGAGHLLELALRQARLWNAPLLLAGRPYSTTWDDQSVHQRVIAKYAGNTVLMQMAETWARQWVHAAMRQPGPPDEPDRMALMNQVGRASGFGAARRLLWWDGTRAVLLELALDPASVVMFAPSPAEAQRYRRLREAGIPAHEARATAASA